MPDPFIREDPGPGNPIAVPPADSDLAVPLRGFMIGGAGNVSVRNMNDQDVTITAPAVGVIHSVRCKRVNSTNTTATGITGFY